MPSSQCLSCLDTLVSSVVKNKRTSQQWDRGGSCVNPLSSPLHLPGPDLRPLYLVIPTGKINNVLVFGIPIGELFILQVYGASGISTKLVVYWLLNR